MVVGDSPIFPPEKPKPYVNFDPKKCPTYYTLFNIESNIVSQEDEQQDFVDNEIVAEIKGFFATENLNAETEKDKVLNWCNLKKTKNPHLVSYSRKYFAARSSFLYSGFFFLKLGNCTSKSVIDCFKRPAKTFYFFTIA